MKKKLIMLSAILGLVFILSACNESIDQDIVGKWEDDVTGFIMFEFDKKGDILIQTPGGKEITTFTTKGDKLTIDREGKKEEYTYTIENDELALNNGDQTILFIKAAE